MSALTDPIADMLTRIRNAQNVHHPEVMVPASKLKASIARILKREGYIRDFALEGTGAKKTLRLQLKYAGQTPVILGLSRMSRPGCRRYIGAKEKPRVRVGMSLVVLSTSRGLLTAVEARKANVGGEMLCCIW